nr:monodehydroascorbate reductase [Tanacetum cinerariifolium]
FFRAFTASSTIPSIYIQQFWDTIQYEKTAGCFRCQLDEHWFVLTKDTLREALHITPVKSNQAFIPPPIAEVLINFVNEQGYPKLVRNVSNTSGFERPREPVLQILLGIIKRANIDYAERIWEEFTQSIHTFIEDKRNLSRHTSGKKRATLIVIPSIRFTKLIIHHLQRRYKFHPRPNSPLHFPNEELVLGYLKFSAKGTKKEVFEMPIPGSLITADIQEASYYREYLAKVAQHQRYLAGETGSNPVSPASKPTKPARKPKSTVPKAPPRPTVSKKRTLKNVEASKAKEVPAMEPQVAVEDTDLQKALEESMKTAYALPKGLLPPVVIREPESRKYQPLPEVSGKGKAKLTEEESDSEDESEKFMLGADEGGQDEGQAGPDPGAQAENQTGSDASAQDEDQAGSNPNETTEGQAGPDPGDAGAKADMKEILHQRIWETESYKSHEDHMQLFKALEKSINRDHSDELAQDLAEARKKKKKSRESPKTPPGSPSHQSPPHPPPAGPFGPLGAPKAFGSSQVPPPPPPPSSTSQQSPSAHIPTVNLRQGWWKPFEEERPATLKPAWSIRSSDVPVPTNNWASALASNYSPPPEDSLLAQTGDIATFMDWFCKRRGITELKPQDMEGPAYEIVKDFHPDVIHLQYQMEECHKLLTDSLDDPILRHDVSKPLPLGGPPGQVTIQSDFFFNKDLEYLRYGSKGRKPALSISKMKAAYYPDAGLEQMVPDQF